MPGVIVTNAQCSINARMTEMAKSISMIAYATRLSISQTRKWFQFLKARENMLIEFTTFLMTMTEFEKYVPFYNGRKIFNWSMSVLRILYKN